MFCLAVCVFSETDALVVDAEERLCSEEARERLRLLPLSVARLLTSAGDAWRPLGVQGRVVDSEVLRVIVQKPFRTTSRLPNYRESSRETVG